ncbi:MAG: Lrp/AsnC family transcriptional regulator [Pseudomonadota bacterium]
MADLDRIDIRLLELLQADSSLTLETLATEVGLSMSACHRRVRILERDTIIDGYGARIGAAKLGLALSAFVHIVLNDPSPDAMATFERAVAAMDDVIECHLFAGSGEYLLRVQTTDMAEFDAIHRERLARLPHVGSMTPRFVGRTIKSWQGVSLSRLGMRKMPPHDGS